jgi:hypothetical protein
MGAYLYFDNGFIVAYSANFSIIYFSAFFLHKTDLQTPDSSQARHHSLNSISRYQSRHRQRLL